MNIFTRSLTATNAFCQDSALLFNSPPPPAPVCFYFFLPFLHSVPLFLSISRMILFYLCYWFTRTLDKEMYAFYWWPFPLCNRTENVSKKIVGELCTDKYWSASYLLLDYPKIVSILIFKTVQVLHLTEKVVVEGSKSTFWILCITPVFWNELRGSSSWNIGAVSKVCISTCS